MNSSIDSYWAEMGRSSQPPSRSEFQIRTRVLKHHLRDVLPRISRGPACDIGCGRGENLGALAMLGFSPVSGCDIGEPQVQAARGAGLSAVVADAHQFLAHHTELALVTAFDVIEHMNGEQGEALARQAFASLRSEGWLVLQFPNCGSPFGGKIQFADPTHVSPLTPARVERMLRKIGFGTVKCMEAGPVPHSAAGVLRSAAWAAIRAAVAAWELVETGAASGPYTRVCLVAGRKDRAA